MPLTLSIPVDESKEGLWLLLVAVPDTKTHCINKSSTSIKKEKNYTLWIQRRAIEERKVTEDDTSNHTFDILQLFIKFVFFFFCFLLLLIGLPF